MKLFLTVLLSAFLGMPAQAAQVGNVRIWSEANRTQVILDLSGLIRYSLFALTHPERIVIAGGLVELGTLLFGPLQDAFRRHVEGSQYRPPIAIVPAELGERAGAVGAAVLARELLT